MGPHTLASTLWGLMASADLTSSSSQSFQTLGRETLIGAQRRWGHAPGTDLSFDVT